MRLVAPFWAISRELSILRELYELDLASHTPPVVRITESPSRGDTEVLYSDESGKPKSKIQRLKEAWDGFDDD